MTEAKATTTSGKAETSSASVDTEDYTTWDRAALLARVTTLERELAHATKRYTQLTNAIRTETVSELRKGKKKVHKPFDPTKYTTRHIALKFAYLGGRYNGFEHHVNNTTPLPTIEEELWKALRKTKLLMAPPVFNRVTGVEEVSWEGCEYSKCGRTDRGVSAFGQVVGLKVRSAKPMRLRREEDCEGSDEEDGMEDVEHETKMEEKTFDPVHDELPYIQLLNNVLPSDIRILAWCPSPPEDFSARFSCRERRYRYFFTNPAFHSSSQRYEPYTIPEAEGKNRLCDGYLDIEAMQEAAQHYVGLHDFRNFCKLDPTKQITNFQRRIFHAGISCVNPGTKGSQAVYSFDVNGSAFLWHQIRHLVAILFLVGQRLEPPSVVADLLDVKKTPTRPHYEMASDAPLVLWDCIFPIEGDGSRQNALKWVYATENRDLEGTGHSQSDANGYDELMKSLWHTWRSNRIDEVLSSSLLALAEKNATFESSCSVVNGSVQRQPHRGSRYAVIFDGSSAPKPTANYVPLMTRQRLEHFEDVNARWRNRKGLGAVPTASMENDADE